MEGLQRSEISFRRQGSSGLVWDDKVLSGELKKISTKAEDGDDDHHHHNKAKSETRDSKPSVQRSRSNGGRAYRSTNVAPSADPPSPKVSGCCGVFGKPEKKSSQPQRKSGARRKS